MRLIDADTLREKLEHTDTDVCADYGDGFCQFGYSRSLVNLLLSETPTIDAVPVVHGRWILPTKIGHYCFDIPHCSACYGVPCGVDENTNYCPHCGAKMDGDDNAT